MSHLVHSQSDEFIIGPILGFHGIEINGDIESVYSASNGYVTGTGGLSFGL